ncbi:hypothetical protein GCM10012290_18680 [Halolactibacillus alkaliphilus]|uniref:Glycosyl hydrolase 36 catalytic domain-containing protein n=1 Tax=Halolactibacillus alkaliphilus TaxID=442899 RepID=A0A511X2M9_9BACI|nr:hypothetical protein [Halolactibacillus alkaliphilus]GEN57210.1 hypothetical protein HAL01_16740 [Halolactibacillus alkaliphilus]GGN72583.1 hypothetical protein GCM10012290_18680 [Halolactibacillus alkaliphilus]SFO91185.1 hypothetical protein SAMN05720591_12145 [Halolactibacillus alkaliphilus]
MKTLHDLYLGNGFLRQYSKAVSLKMMTLNNETFFKIEHVNQMTPFFMTVVSDTDHWLFVSSTGGLTAGRKNAESALFPYETDDKIHDSVETTGPDTTLIVTKGEKDYLWKPFSTHLAGVYHITRNLYKNTTGDKIIFEEINTDLGLTFNYTLKTSEAYGFIKQSTLINTTDEAVSVRVLDGLRNILPYGVNTLLQTTKSTLVDGYKRSELHEDVGLGIYTLSSILTDKAEPSESLKATTVWSKGLDQPTYLLSEQQIKAFSSNGHIETEEDVKGRRGAYYVSDVVELQAGTEKSWSIVAELNQSAADILKLKQTLAENHALLEEVEKDVTHGSENLRQLVFNADGFQHTANDKASYRHFSNTLYNIMRGGIYADGYMIDKQDLTHFVKQWNQAVYRDEIAFFAGLPNTLHYNDLLDRAQNQKNTNLERLLFEYLPLTFSRRHGDPSRPWNKFNIEVTKEDGSKALNFEGNWRDIFQNWEALSFSYPAFTESIIAKFVNASTADGYNPYRITKEGIDWEVLDPEDPWSNIGYWGDHQIIYLLKLLELSKDYNPEKLQILLAKDMFAYANVPYRIKGFEALVKDPRNSIIYDDQKEAAINERVQTIGSDGKLIFHNDSVYHVNLMEKLLVTLLAKFSNYVPEGGIWMNTQRPEWNDANNALVGNGLSMVTLYYMYRFQVYMDQLVKELPSESINVSAEVKQMFDQTFNILKSHESILGEPISDDTRFMIVKALGEIGESYRETVYNDGFSGEKAELSVRALQDFIDVSLSHLKDTIVKNKREDGLYHAYNLIRFNGNSCNVDYLYEMLEGQVAVLSSKALPKEEVINVLASLKESAIYRQDQNSYMLYPNRDLPKFLEKNIIPAEDVQGSVILKQELEAKQTRIIEQDVDGRYHFNGRFRNGEEVREALEALGCYNEADIIAVEDLFTNLFNHHAFTGRSGTFYKYEGLGSIYWHMVSKLLLATQENFNDVYHAHGMTEEAKQLVTYYRDIKAGIGVDKTPEEYGAFPTEAYSHTPSFAGVQQPGMTGQVKEDILSRFGELGVTVKNGQLSFDPVLLSKAEFLTTDKEWSLAHRQNLEATPSLTLTKDTIGFTTLTVPVIYVLSDEEKMIVTDVSGRETVYQGHTLDPETSQMLFGRHHDIVKITVSVDQSKLV